MQITKLIIKVNSNYANVQLVDQKNSERCSSFRQRRVSFPAQKSTNKRKNNINVHKRRMRELAKSSESIFSGEIVQMN